MSRLNELIQRLCPNGVEYETIKETVGVNRGKRLTKSQLSDDGKYEVYHGSKDSILGKYYEYNAPANTVIVINTGGIGGVKFLDKPFWCSDGSFWLGQSSRINNKYLYYYLSGYENYFYSQKRVGGVPTIERRVVEDFKIPIPPLDVQNEIVRILDTFTSHAAELQAELQARKEQYEYYRNKLLTFDKDDKNVKWMKLGDVCTLNRGIRVVRNDLNKNGKYPVYQNSLTPLGYYDKSNYPKNTTFIISAGAAGEIGFSKEPMWAADDCLCIICTDDLVSKYVYHYLIEHKIFLISKIRKASIPRLSRVTIEQLPIAIPNISEQQRIVSILDKFEALVNDLTDGLPAEIAAVQEQYEYYRNKLLTFK